MLLLVFALAAAATALAHTAPFPFLIDALHADRVIWRMPHASGPPTVYLTYDDGPNPAATPAVLDALASEGVHATFFLIERHITADTEPIVRRIAAEGHALALHSHTRATAVLPPEALARQLTAFAARLQDITGRPPCRAFRPHAGMRTVRLLEGLERIDYQMVGWGFFLWDYELFRARSERSVPRLVRYASAGDIVVIHDGDHKDPRADRQSAIAITRALIPALRRHGFHFGQVCP